MDKLQFTSIRQFATQIGREKLRAQKIYPQLVESWCQRGTIPAAWIPVFWHIYGADLPLHLFNVNLPIAADPPKHLAGQP